jgi:hypothetical protein
MALGDVLGVLSEAIRSDVPPEDLAALIAGHTGLSDAERDDLERIPYARLVPYQHDIYQAERNMLVWGFSNTWACLRALNFGGAADDAGDCERAFVVSFKRDCPCETHSVREMGARFLDFLASVHHGLCAAYPWLIELAEVERLEIEVLYALDNPVGRALDEPSRDVFFSQSVGALLMAQVVRAERVHIVRLFHAIPAIKSAISGCKEGGAVLDLGGPAFERLAEPMYLGIARDHDSLEPAWYFASEADEVCIAAVGEDTPAPVEEHAMRVLDRLVPGEATPKEQLAGYLVWLERAFRLRYLLLA